MTLPSILDPFYHQKQTTGILSRELSQELEVSHSAALAAYGQHHRWNEEEEEGEGEEEEEEDVDDGTDDDDDYDDKFHKGFERTEYISASTVYIIRVQ